jgi:hypothetical protein
MGQYRERALGTCHRTNSLEIRMRRDESRITVEGSCGFTQIPRVTLICPTTGRASSTRSSNVLVVNNKNKPRISRVEQQRRSAEDPRDQRNQRESA